ncbi:MAG: histidinol phosphate phosphatase, partial [Deltaproteobacteria bacterium]|nr:histidinol phosphate phosphatase [Deltaproteobacteria bacterium]
VDHVYQRYFDTLLKMIDTGLFDIVTHPDLVKKFGHRPESLDLAALYHETAQRIRRQNMCLEVNTAGLRKEVGEIYPEKQFLEIARQYKVPIVIGSDAHCPGEVGADYAKAMALVRSVGYTHVQQFSGRTAVPVPL